MNFSENYLFEPVVLIVPQNIYPFQYKVSCNQSFYSDHVKEIWVAYLLPRVDDTFWNFGLRFTVYKLRNIEKCIFGYKIWSPTQSSSQCSKKEASSDVKQIIQQ